MHLELPKAPGVYAIECTGNDKIYIGSGANMRERQTDHLRRLRSGQHCNPKLQHAYNKYGEQSFFFYVIEWALNTRFAIEKYWITALDSVIQGFNCNSDTVAPFLGRRHSLRTRAKMSIAQSGAAHPMFGKHHTSISKHKISRTLCGRVFSSVTKSKMCQARKHWWNLRHAKMRDS